MTIALRAEASRAIVVLDGVDRVAFNEDGSLELLTPAAGTPTGNKVPTAGQLPFTKEFVSAPQSCVASGLLTLVHGLGVKPKLIAYSVVCTTAVEGYSVGDEVLLTGGTYGDNNAAYGIGPTSTVGVTDITIRFGNGVPFLVNNKTTGAHSSYINMAPNFKLVVRAWA